MSRVSQVCWLILLITAAVAALLVRFRHGGARESTPDTAKLRAEVQAERALRREADLERSNAALENAQLRETLRQVALERSKWQQIEAERDAYRQNLRALEQQLADKRDSEPGITFPPPPVANLTESDVDTSGSTSSGVPHGLGAGGDTTIDAQERYDATLCANHLFQLGLAAEQWAALHDDAMPPDFLSLRDYLAPMILACPSAKRNLSAWTWRSFDPAMITYRYRLQNWSNELRWRTGATQTFAECPIHGIVVNTGSPPLVGIPTRYVR